MGAGQCLAEEGLRIEGWCWGARVWEWMVEGLGLRFEASRSVVQVCEKDCGEFGWVNESVRAWLLRVGLGGRGLEIEHLGSCETEVQCVATGLRQRKKRTISWMAHRAMCHQFQLRWPTNCDSHASCDVAQYFNI